MSNVSRTRYTHGYMLVAETFFQKRLKLLFICWLVLSRWVLRMLSRWNTSKDSLMTLFNSFDNSNRARFDDLITLSFLITTQLLPFLLADSFVYCNFWRNTDNFHTFLFILIGGDRYRLSITQTQPMTNY